MKFAEALAKGKDMVASVHVTRGVAGRDAFLRSDDPTVFADYVVQLLSNSELRQRYEKRALDFAREHFARERVYASLKALLESDGLHEGHHLKGAGAVNEFHEVG